MNSHIWLSLGTEFQLNLTILIFWIKFVQSKTEKLNITIEFCIFKMFWVPNFSLHWQFWFKFGCSPVNWMHIFWTHFPKNISRRLLPLQIYFFLFLVLSHEPKQESYFQEIAGLITKNISIFCLSWFTFHFKGMPNSINFYKRIFFEEFF